MNPNKYTIDRYDEGFAVLLLRDDENIQRLVPREALDGFAQEGDILLVEFHDDGSLKNAEVLKEETEESKKRIDEIYNRILNRNNK